MKRQLIGGAIIFAGILLLAGIVYVVFFDNFSISDFIDKFIKKEAVQEEIKTEEGAPIKVINGNDAGNANVKKIIIGGAEGEGTGNTADDGQEIEDVNREDLKRLAASFGERYGNFSNHSNFSNIVDLKMFMSKNMKNWADNYIAEQKSKEIDDTIYYGITTKAIGEEIIEFDDDISKAEILVKTRRREAIGTTNNISDIFNQEIIITFVKELGAWKVDSAVWQNK